MPTPTLNVTSTSVFFTAIAILWGAADNHLSAQSSPILSSPIQSHSRPSPTPPTLIPGTGTAVEEVGDDFEDSSWSYQYNLPKVFNHGETSLAKNTPGGVASNDRWYEGSKRGQPDSLRRVIPPTGGLPGSNVALALRSLRTGSTHPTYMQQQDDLIASVSDRIGKIPVSQSPSVVTRVWFPPFEQWEQRNGCHFAFRIAMETNPTPFQSAGYHRAATAKPGVNWPGFFVNLEMDQRSAVDDGPQKYRASMWLKADRLGKRLTGPAITQTGWWTLGIALSPDGKVHYYAKPGVEDLTAADHVASAYPHGERAICLRNFFFNVCSGDDGKTWSSEFVIDDPTLYVVQ